MDDTRPSGEGLVWCRRLLQHRTVSEHRDCPYCFGKPDEVRTAKHEAFCDFRPGKDPIHFGFPEDFGRYRR